MMTRIELSNLAMEMEIAKHIPEKNIGAKHLDFLNMLSMLYFEIAPKAKPTFREMFVFAYQKPTKAMMKIWLRNYKKEEADGNL